MGDPVLTAKAAAQAAAARVASGQRGADAAAAVVTVYQAMLDSFTELASRGTRYNREVVRSFQQTWLNLRSTIILGESAYSRLGKPAADSLWGTQTATIASGILIINGTRITSVPVAPAAFADWMRINQPAILTGLSKARQRQSDALAQVQIWMRDSQALTDAWHRLEANAAAAVDAGTTQGRTIIDAGTPTTPGARPPGARPPQPGSGLVTLPPETVTASRPGAPIWPWVVVGVLAVGFAGFLLLGGKKKRAKA